MRQLLGPVLLVFLLAAACGSDSAEVTSGEEGSESATSVDKDGAEESRQPDDAPPGQDEELAKLNQALETWSENGHAQYSFGYLMQCECYFGPWDIDVENGDLVSFVVEDGDADSPPPYSTIEDIFNEIEATIAEGRIPVRVRYDEETGVPREYIWNEPEIPVDGGFTWTLETFDPEETGPDRDAMRDDLDAARRRWVVAELPDYDYTYEISCFCVSNGPFEVQVRSGAIVSITGPPDENLTDEFLDDVVPSIDEFFATIEEAIGDAESISMTYDSEFGNPTVVDVDYSSRAEDDEILHMLTLRPAQQ